MGKQKVNCRVFTPEKMVCKMLDIIGYKEDLFGKRILENSCGDGRFLVEIVKRYINDCRAKGYDDAIIQTGLEQDINAFEIDKETYLHCIGNLNQVLIDYAIAEVKWSIKNSDALKAKLPADFSYVVGNPPYITYSALSQDERFFIKNKFHVCKEGKPDYYYAFIESALKCLGKQGQLVYLVPSNFFKTRFARRLREYILPFLSEIYDYTNEKVFDSALTFSAIIVCDKNTEKRELVYHDIMRRSSFSISKDTLISSWIFHDNCEDEDNNQMQLQKENLVRFGDVFSAASSIATLYNEAFIIKNRSESDINIEPELLFKAASPKSQANSSVEYIIFPYWFDEKGGIQRYSEDAFFSRFPNTVNHLSSFRDKLDARDSDTTAKWFEYGRSQAIMHLHQKKLLLSTLVTDKVKVFELDERTIPYSGIYIITKSSEYSLSDAKHILEDDRFFEYVKRVGVYANGTSVRISISDVNNYSFCK